MAMLVNTKQWSREQIAALSNSQLAHLNYDEMVEVVLTSGVPLRDAQSVRTMESDALVRLVHWSWQFCRSQAAQDKT
jgi:hypothetical protein